ncbi:hypothetical protein [Marinisporobacter balticus]|uniref:Uncharacterized protein n=1 Tax=Marinisporobacter balticus TaxID=2018667 RepID=A0A4R2KNW6_9FIRM|nr:hypothetical protein [Marinisporobacter balticus]TCO74422.1 hypothetical protein EV214_11368 [Marinisporobacter balticus]
MFPTSITIGSGRSGSILTPVFYICATAGNAWGQIISGHKSVYPSQILMVNKSPSMDFQVNCEIGEVQEPKIKDKHKIFKRFYENKGV